MGNSMQEPHSHVENVDENAASTQKKTLELSPQADQTLKEAADKAQFSNFIGGAWEVYAERHLGELLQEEALSILPDGHTLVGFFLLDINPKIKAEAKGLKIPDAVLIEVDANDKTKIYLRACDFKFSLPRAKYIQVSPRTLLSLIENSPSAQSALATKVLELQKSESISADITVTSIRKNQTDEAFLSLDEAGSIRLETGKFLSPQTEENADYFAGPSSIHKENVVLISLSPEECVEILKETPGIEYIEEASRLPINEEMAYFDKALVIARAAAVMKAYGLTSIDQVVALITGKEVFEPLQKQKKPLLKAAFQKQFGSKLKQHTPRIATLFENELDQDDSLQNKLKELFDELALEETVRLEILEFVAQNNS